MNSRIAALSIDAANPSVVADFWCQVLDYVVTEQDEEGISIGPREPGARPAGIPIDIFPVPERKTVKNRLHLDLRADGWPQHDELARLLAIGATRVDVGQAPDVSWIVLADPEGNEFCLLQRTVQEAAADR